jgi:hypothetical protein
MRTIEPIVFAGDHQIGTPMPQVVVTFELSLVNFVQGPSVIDSGFQKRLATHVEKYKDVWQALA